MTNKERNAIADAIRAVYHQPLADKATCAAITQSLQSYFRDDSKFYHFTLTACGLYTNVDYRAKLRGDAPANPNTDAN